MFTFIPVRRQQARRRAVAQAAWQVCTERGHQATLICQLQERAGALLGTVTDGARPQGSVPAGSLGIHLADVTSRRRSGAGWAARYARAGVGVV